MVDLAKIAKKKADAEKKGGEWFKPENGETLLFLHPQCRPDDEDEPTAGLNWIEAVYHYSVGGKDGVVGLCLNPKKNPIILHPVIQEYLAKKNVQIDPDEGCPVCEALDGDDMSDEDKEEARPQTKFVWGVTPISIKRPGETKATALELKPSIYSCGKTVWDGFTEMYNEAGDVSDVNAAVFVKLIKTGKGKNGTKYQVNVDMKSAKQPQELPENMRSLIEEAIAPDGDCDLFRVVASNIKSAAALRAALTGVKLEEDEEEAPPARGKGKPAPSRTSGKGTTSRGSAAAVSTDEEETPAEEVVEEEQPAEEEAPAEEAVEEQPVEEEEAPAEEEQAAEEEPPAEEQPAEEEAPAEEEPPPPPPPPAKKPATPAPKPAAKPAPAAAAKPAAKPAAAAPAKPATPPAKPATGTAKPAAPAAGKPAPGKPAAPAGKPAAPAARPATKPATKPAAAPAGDDDDGVDALAGELRAMTGKKK